MTTSHGTRHPGTQWYSGTRTSNFAERSLKSFDLIRSPEMALGIHDEIRGICLEQDAKESHWSGYTLRKTVWY